MFCRLAAITGTRVGLEAENPLAAESNDGDTVLVGTHAGPTLAAIHNLTFLAKLMARMRESIEADRFEEFGREFLATYQRKKGSR